MKDSERTSDSRRSGTPNGNGNGRRAGGGKRGGGDGNGRWGVVVPLRPEDEPSLLAQIESERPRRKVRIRKLRVFALLCGLGVLAAVSTVFGMMMALASDLPALEQPSSANSVVVDRTGRELGLLVGNQNRILLNESQISPAMKQAIVSIEDQRFFTNDGVDLRGIVRALVADVRHRRAVQGASTITQQFVKNALAAQNNRDLFTKMREAALAYHLTRKWTKQQILRNYLNTIYFGNGAYGIEAAARTYFGWNHPGCTENRRRPCALELLPHEGALLAGVVASPSAYDPVANRRAAHARRDLVLDRMHEQGYLTEPQYRAALAEPLPSRADIRPPTENTRYPYFTSWIKQQVVDRLGGGSAGARVAFEGGLSIRTTLDARIQDAAEHAIGQWLAPGSGPQASLVAIDNRTAEVRAMVGGEDYSKVPFNLATQGRRQPGSAFKPFVLANALTRGIGLGSVWESKKMTFDVPHSTERFTVRNYENAYAGKTTLARATTFSDNAVYAQVGIRSGTRRTARLARRMGIRTPVSTNWAMTLGGLREGVTPLDLAHAYGTFANRGRLVYGTLSPGRWSRSTRRAVPGPVGIRSISRPDGNDLEAVTLPDGRPARNRTRTRQVLDAGIAQSIGEVLRTVVTQGTGTRAQLAEVPVSGKTGTTENYGDAWFVGWTRDYTVAVWVGYPDRFKAMKTDFRGDPVSGGTYPAGIWKTFMEQVLKIDPPSQSERDDKEREPDVPGVTPTPGALPSSPGTAAPSGPATTGQGGGPDEDGGTDAGTPAQEEVPATGGTTPDTGADAGTGETPVAPVDPGAQAAPDGQAAPADQGAQP